MVGGGSGHKARQCPAESTMGWWSCPGIVLAHSSVLIASRLVGFAGVWYFPQTTPVWISCWRGSWLNRSCCAEPPIPREQGGREAGPGTDYGSRSFSVYVLALYLVATCASGIHGARKDSPSTEKGHCSALRLKAEPESTNWFGGSEVTRSPVLPEFGLGMPGPPGSHFLPVPNWHWQAVAEPLAAS